ncbi:MAG TPA: hypothetical protein VN695_10430 [Streptosporangiaceae bacterium]|nr:hypothetical protein [Streptosporangiaceae bacterium]
MGVRSRHANQTATLAQSLNATAEHERALADHACDQGPLLKFRSADTHDRVRTDKVGTTGTVTLRHSGRTDIVGTTGTVTLRHAGRLYHIGIGRTHAGTHILLLVQDLQARIINAATSELLRQLTLDPTRSYQPTGRPPGPPPGTPRPPRHPRQTTTPNP